MGTVSRHGFHPPEAQQGGQINYPTCPPAGGHSNFGDISAGIDRKNRILVSLSHGTMAPRKTSRSKFASSTTEARVSFSWSGRWGLQDAYTDMKYLDFARVTEAIGMLAIRVGDAEELGGAVREWLAYDGPALLVSWAPSELVMRPSLRDGALFSQSGSRVTRWRGPTWMACHDWPPR